MKTTAERIAVLEEKVDQVGRDVCDLKADFDKFIASAESRFASKLTEKIVYGMVGTIVTAVLLALVYLVLEH